MTIGLLLEGGGMRGLYTAGILDVLMDNNIVVNHIVGVSAGALFGVNYISKQRGRAIRYNKKYASDKRYMGIQSLIKTGNIVNKDFTYYTIPQQLDVFDNDTYKSSFTTLHVTLTNVNTGQAEYVLIKDVFEQMEELRATSALPFVSQMVVINNNLYLDGGIASSIPIDFMQTMNNDKLIVILTQPIGYEKKASNLLVNKIVYCRYPNLVEALNNRHLMYNEELTKVEKLEKENKAFVIRPSQSINVKRLEKDSNELERVYQLGVEDGRKQLETLKAYLKK